MLNLVRGRGVYALFPDRSLQLICVRKQDFEHPALRRTRGGGERRSEMRMCLRGMDGCTALRCERYRQMDRQAGQKPSSDPILPTQTHSHYTIHARFASTRRATRNVRLTRILACLLVCLLARSHAYNQLSIFYIKEGPVSIFSTANLMHYAISRPCSHSPILFPLPRAASNALLSSGSPAAIWNKRLIMRDEICATHARQPQRPTSPRAVAHSLLAARVDLRA